MSCVFVVVPVVAGSWPIISAAVIAACAGLGYQSVRRAENAMMEGTSVGVGATDVRAISLRMDDSQVIADTLMRGESITFERDGITAIFRVDGRGACTVHVAGAGRSDVELAAEGRQIMDRVRQQFAYAKVMAELEQRGFHVINQDVQANRTISIRVRR